MRNKYLIWKFPLSVNLYILLICFKMVCVIDSKTVERYLFLYMWEYRKIIVLAKTRINFPWFQIYFFIIFHWGIVDLWVLHILLGLRDVESLYPKEWKFLHIVTKYLLVFLCALSFGVFIQDTNRQPHKCPQGLFNIEEYVRTLFVQEWQNLTQIWHKWKREVTGSCLVGW